jgi:hypothetical protein
MFIDDAATLKQWSKTAKGGERVTYFRGRYASPDGQTSCSVVRMARELSEAAEVALFQRRIPGGDGLSDYIAVRLRDPHAIAVFGPISPEVEGRKRKRAHV